MNSQRKQMHLLDLDLDKDPDCDLDRNPDNFAPCKQGNSWVDKSVATD